MGWHVKAAILVTLLAGCGAESLPLAGRQFLLSSSEGFTPVSGTTVRLGFQDRELNVSAGCNGMFGDYTLRDGVLDVAGLGSTLKGCAADLAAQDQRLAEFITSKPSLSLLDNQLTLAGGGTTLVFLDREVADPDRPLVATQWEIDTLIKGDFASSGRDMPEPRIVFAQDGTFNVFGPCNTAGGRYGVQGSRITLSEVSVDEAACAGSQGMIEAHLWSVFKDGAALSFEIEASTIRIMNGDLGVAGRVKEP
ncbi:MAG: META domain-containing protein [Polyangiales bacterium]